MESLKITKRHFNFSLHKAAACLSCCKYTRSGSPPKNKEKRKKKKEKRKRKKYFQSFGCVYSRD